MISIFVAASHHHLIVLRELGNHIRLGWCQNAVRRVCHVVNHTLHVFLNFRSRLPSANAAKRMLGRDCREPAPAEDLADIAAEASLICRELIT